MAKVSLVTGESRKENVKAALELITDEIKARGKVLVKPNLVATVGDYCNTHVDAIAGVVEFLNENFGGLDITVGEGSGGAFLTGKRTGTVFEKYGYRKLEEYDNVSLLDFDDWQEFGEIEIRMISGKRKMRIMKHDFDYVVSLSLPKTHDFAIATFGIKNMMGMIHREDRMLMHGFGGSTLLQTGNSMVSCLPGFISRPLKEFGKMFVGGVGTYPKSVRVIHRNLAEFAKAVRPDLVVLDGMYGMEGEGPVCGDGIRLGVAVSSTDPLKADGVGARLMGLEPGEIGYLHYLSEAGYGDYSLKGLVGERVEEHAKKFRMHPKFGVQKGWK